MAREISLPRAEAERVLQTATAQFAVHRDVSTTHIRPLFDPLARADRRRLVAAGVDPAARGRGPPAYPHPGRRGRRCRRRPDQRIPGLRCVRRAPDARARRRERALHHPVGQPARTAGGAARGVLRGRPAQRLPGVRPRGRSALDRDLDQRQHRGQRAGHALPGDPLRRPSGCGGVDPRVRQHARRQPPEDRRHRGHGALAHPAWRTPGLPDGAGLVRRLRRNRVRSWCPPIGSTASATRRRSSS